MQQATTSPPPGPQPGPGPGTPPAAPLGWTSGSDVSRWILRFLVFGFLVYLAGVKPIGISADLLNYQFLYDRAALTPVRDILLDSDAAFFLLANLCARAGLSFNGFAFLVALLTISLLAASLKGLKAKPLVLLLLYGSYLFWLHPYTQIRTGLSSALLIFGFYGARRINWAAIFGALMVHNSMVIAIAGYLGLRVRPIFVAGAAGVLGLALILGVAQAPIQALTNRALAYQDLALSGVFTEINIFSLMPLSMIGFLLLGTVYAAHLSKQEIVEGILSWIGVVAFYLLRDTPVLAFRVWEIFMIFFVILAARLWDRSLVFKLAVLPYVALGIRSTFFSPNSLVILAA